jgi:hypothetical protein
LVPANRRDPRLDILATDDAPGAGHLDFEDLASLDAEQIVGAGGLDDPARRHRARGADVGRAEHRDRAETVGVVDKIAEPDDIARHGDAAFECWRKRRLRRRQRAGDLRHGSVRGRSHKRDRDEARQETAQHDPPPVSAAAPRPPTASGRRP